MAKNELLVNRPRIGWYFDGLPDEVTPSTATMLQDDGHQITLTIPWRDEGTPGQLQRWFNGVSTSYGDDPDRTKYSYELPRELNFTDVEGSAVLIGCSNGGSHEQLALFSNGRGVVRVQLVVLDTGSLKFKSIDGLRTEIPELADWLGLTSIREDVRRDEAGRATGARVDLNAPDSIQLSRRLNLRLVPHWRAHRSPNGPFSLHDEVLVETRTTRARSWDDHLQAHQLVREMIDIAAWRPFGYRQIAALRDDDPIRVMSGERVDEKWCDVRTYAVRIHEPNEGRQHFLFVFAHVGSAGFRRWMRTREHFARGVTPILALLDATGTHVESQLTQAAIGLEAIGYRIALDLGVPEKKAANEPLASRLQRLEGSLPLGVVLPGWAQRAADAYNGVKHANRAQPGFAEMINVLRENILVFRTWAATQMGVAPRVIAERWMPDSGFQMLSQQGLAPRPIVLR